MDYSAFMQPNNPDTVWADEEEITVYPLQWISRATLTALFADPSELR